MYRPLAGCVMYWVALAVFFLMAMTTTLASGEPVPPVLYFPLQIASGIGLVIAGWAIWVTYKQRRTG